MTPQKVLQFLPIPALLGGLVLGFFLGRSGPEAEAARHAKETQDCQADLTESRQAEAEITRIAENESKLKRELLAIVQAFVDQAEQAAAEETP